MGQPHVIDEQPGDMVPKKEMSFKDKLARDMAEAHRLCGPSPTLPAFLVERGVAPATIDPQTGLLVWGTDPGFLGDPTAAQVAADYQADVQAWKEKFKLIFTELRKQ